MPLANEKGTGTFPRSQLEGTQGELTVGRCGKDKQNTDLGETEEKPTIFGKPELFQSHQKTQA